MCHQEYYCSRFELDSIFIEPKNHRPERVFCFEDCQIAELEGPSMICRQNILTLTWPTSETYTGEITKVPQEIRGILRDRIKTRGTMLQMVILNSQSP